jgi:DNA adenine methylase
MDPPYWTTVGYGVDFGADQYEQMADMIGSLQGKAMITLNDHPDIRTVFSRYRMEEVSIRYSVGTGRMRADKRKELVIFNW